MSRQYRMQRSNAPPAHPGESPVDCGVSGTSRGLLRMSYNAEYQRRRRAADPEYAERQRELSRAAKRRRIGVCERCGGETRYNGVTNNGPSTVCGACIAEQNHAERRWTKETIVRAFIRFRDETGRTPRCADVQGLSESQVLKFSGRRIREIEQVRELGLVLPSPGAVRREYGNWAAALVAAGLDPSSGGGSTHRRSW